MRRLALVIAAVLVLAAPVFAADTSGSSADDRLAINPFSRPVEPAAHRNVFDRLFGYAGNRVRDFADIFTFKFGWGTYRSIGFQARVCYPLQVGAGYFEGWVFVIDRGCIGTMKEAEIEGGLSIFYPSFIARKVYWQTGEAERRNVFFGNLGDAAELSLDDLRYYDDENAGAFDSTIQIQLPALPKIELTIHWPEVFDFPLSFFPIDGFRVPSPFYKIDSPDGERIPAPASVFWHGQEEHESYE